MYLEKYKKNFEDIPDLKIKSSFWFIFINLKISEMLKKTSVGTRVLNFGSYH